MIGVVGPGAVGHMLSFFIQNSTRLPLQVLGRSGPQDMCAEIFWDNTWHQLKVEQNSSLCELLLVVVKSYDLSTALAAALPRLKAGGTVVLLGNGYLENFIAPLRSQWPELRWRKGIVTRGVRLEALGRFVLSREGEVVWGSSEEPQGIERELTQALAEQGFRWDARSCELRKDKWFYNTVLNTLAGVYHLPSNGDATRLFSQELELLAQEVFALGKELWPEWSASWQRLWNGLLQLIQATASNENSMARDVRLGRKTEAAVLSGCIELAREPEKFPLLANYHRRLLH